MHTPIHHALGITHTELTGTLIEHAVARRVPETTDLDWKSDSYHRQNPKWQAEASKDFAAMANSGGGWIVLGVADTDDCADHIVGVTWSATEEQRLRKVAHDRVFPPLRGLEFYPVVAAEELTVALLRVPDSPGHLHAVRTEGNGFTVPYRNGPDTDFYGPREVGAALLAYANGEQAATYLAGATIAPELAAPPGSPRGKTEPDTSLDRLHDWLLDPTKVLHLYRVVLAEADAVVETINGLPITSESILDGELFETIVNSYDEALAPLANLVTTGIWHDLAGLHDQTWIDVLQRLASAGGQQPSGQYQKPLLFLRFYPALYLLMAAGIACLSRRREGLFIRLCTDVTGHYGFNDSLQPAHDLMHPQVVLDADWVNAMPRWSGSRWTYAASHLLKATLRPVFVDLITSTEDYEAAFHGVEYRLSLLQGGDAQIGEFVGERSWTWERPSRPLAEVAFREQGERDRDWPWIGQLGGINAYETALLSHRALLAQYQYHRMR